MKPIFSKDYFASKILVRKYLATYGTVLRCARVEFQCQISHNQRWTIKKTCPVPKAQEGFSQKGCCYILCFLFIIFLINYLFHIAGNRQKI